MAGNLGSVTLAREDISGRTEMHPAPRSSDRSIGPGLIAGGALKAAVRLL
ncbi:hypothetical protein X741_01080 [Mesorhizobium sp. LNHC229A00]|nr:hypothetical protein X741_01080 [Mesorhizobium sp. LNHC229A00]